LAIGVILFAVAGFLYYRARAFIRNGVLTTAVIVSIDATGTSTDSDGNETTDYSALVEYTADGTVYRNYLDTYSSSMRVGQTVPIRYLPNDPNKIQYAKNEYMAVWLLGGFGAAAVAVSALMFVLAARSGGAKSKLQQTGRLVTAAVNSVDVNYKIDVNGSHPAKVVCTGTDGAVYTSKTVYDYWVFMPGDPIDVYVGGENNDKYFVDLEAYRKAKAAAAAPLDVRR